MSSIPVCGQSIGLPEHGRLSRLNERDNRASKSRLVHHRIFLEAAIEANMHFQFAVASASPAQSELSDEYTSTGNTADLLRQLLDIQREQLNLLRTNAAVHDSGNRWRSFLARWQDDFGKLPGACKSVLPQLERAYIKLIADLAAQLQDESIDNDFTLSEFLDRYGIRLSQLGAILHLVGPLAEIDSASEEKST